MADAPEEFEITPEMIEAAEKIYMSWRYQDKGAPVTPYDLIIAILVAAGGVRHD